MFCWQVLSAQQKREAFDMGMETQKAVELGSAFGRSRNCGRVPAVEICVWQEGLQQGPEEGSPQLVWWQLHSCDVPSPPASPFRKQASACKGDTRAAILMSWKTQPAEDTPL